MRLMVEVADNDDFVVDLLIMDFSREFANFLLDVIKAVKHGHPPMVAPAQTYGRLSIRIDIAGMQWYSDKDIPFSNDEEDYDYLGITIDGELLEDYERREIPGDVEVNSARVVLLLSEAAYAWSIEATVYEESYERYHIIETHTLQLGLLEQLAGITS